MSDIKVSKTLASLLRHNAQKEGIPIRGDGFCPMAILVTFSAPNAAPSRQT
jgi:RNA:NAD 2'-phosphotransferase (TPT1/KptA family)